MIPLRTFLYLSSVAFSAICLAAPQLHGQSMSETVNGSLELVVNSGDEEEMRLPSHEGVLEPLALTYEQVEPVMLACSPDKEGQEVTLSPLDGEGEIIAPENLVVANDGTVAFSIKAGATPGRYRVLVTVGADQYELQLHVAASPIYVPPPGPLSTPPVQGTD
ncbi:MAG TPA: hypothetical protein VEX43_10070 [Chthoniobacterales bacterium]|nr:hypothetical protein [Chthoniobacterales bacterium]